jgi:hypothetical protein
LAVEDVVRWVEHHEHIIVKGLYHGLGSLLLELSEGQGFRSPAPPSSVLSGRGHPAFYGRRHPPSAYPWV